MDAKTRFIATGAIALMVLGFGWSLLRALPGATWIAVLAIVGCAALANGLLALCSIPSVRPLGARIPITLKLAVVSVCALLFVPLILDMNIARGMASNPFSSIVFGGLSYFVCWAIFQHALAPVAESEPASWWRQPPGNDLHYKWSIAAIVVLVTAPIVAAWVYPRGGGGLASWLFTIAAVFVAVQLTGVLTAHATTVLWSRSGWKPSSAEVARRETVRIQHVLSSTVVLLCVLAITIASYNFANGATFTSSTGEPVRAAMPDVRLDDATDEDLLVGLMPMIVLGENAEPPVAVDEILGVSTLDRAGVETPFESIDQITAIECEDETACATVVFEGCAALDRSCTLTPMDSLEMEGQYVIDQRVAVYTNVLRRERDVDVSWARSPFGERLIGIVQYWVYTPFDAWNHDGPAGLGEYDKSHLGDWESISIGFSAEQPLFVAASAHCGGSWRNWAAVDVWNGQRQGWDPLGTLLHTELYRTDGSFGYYFSTFEQRAPDAASCFDITGIGRSHLYLLNFRDETASGTSAMPTLIRPEESAAVLNAPVVWGYTVDFDFTVAGRRLIDVTTGSRDDPGGPGPPGLRPMYNDPVSAIFCSEKWWGPDGPQGGC